MAIEILAGANGHVKAQSTNTNAITTAAIDTTGAMLLVCSLSEFNAATPPTDSKGNTWVAGASASANGSRNVKIWYVKNPTVGSGHTFTGGAATTRPAIFIAAFSGTDTAANRDQQNSNATTANAVSPGSVTPVMSNELIITGMINHTSSSLTIGSGFTITDQFALNSNAYGGALAYLIQGAAAAINPTWTTSPLVSDDIAAGIDTFQPPGTDPSPNLRSWQQQMVPLLAQ